jgi:hypothetical protein
MRNFKQGVKGAGVEPKGNNHWKPIKELAGMEPGGPGSRTDVSGYDTSHLLYKWSE